MELILILIGISLCFGVLFQVPIRFLPHAVLVGFVGGYTHRYILQISELPFAAVFSAFVIGCISHGFARYTSQPAQIFLVPGVIVLVPGSKIHQAMSEGFTHSAADSAGMIQTILITAISISFGLLLANWLVPSRKEL